MTLNMSYWNIDWDGVGGINNFSKIVLQFLQWTQWKPEKMCSRELYRIMSSVRQWFTDTPMPEVIRYIFKYYRYIVEYRIRPMCVGFWFIRQISIFWALKILGLKTFIWNGIIVGGGIGGIGEDAKKGLIIKVRLGCLRFVGIGLTDIYEKEIKVLEQTKINQVEKSVLEEKAVQNSLIPKHRYENPSCTCGSCLVWLKSSQVAILRAEEQAKLEMDRSKAKIAKISKVKIALSVIFRRVLGWSIRDAINIRYTSRPAAGSEAGPKFVITTTVGKSLKNLGERQVGRGVIEEETHCISCHEQFSPVLYPLIGPWEHLGGRMYCSTCSTYGTTNDVLKAKSDVLKFNCYGAGELSILSRHDYIQTRVLQGEGRILADTINTLYPHLYWLHRLQLAESRTITPEMMVQNDYVFLRSGRTWHNWWGGGYAATGDRFTKLSLEGFGRVGIQHLQSWLQLKELEWLCSYGKHGFKQHKSTMSSLEREQYRALLLSKHHFLLSWQYPISSKVWFGGLELNTPMLIKQFRLEQPTIDEYFKLKSGVFSSKNGGLLRSVDYNMDQVRMNIINNTNKPKLKIREIAYYQGYDKDLCRRPMLYRDEKYWRRRIFLKKSGGANIFYEAVAEDMKRMEIYRREKLWKGVFEKYRMKGQDITSSSWVDWEEFPPLYPLYRENMFRNLNERTRVCNYGFNCGRISEKQCFEVAKLVRSYAPDVFLTSREVKEWRKNRELKRRPERVNIFNEAFVRFRKENPNSSLDEGTFIIAELAEYKRAAQIYNKKVLKFNNSRIIRHLNYWNQLHGGNSAEVTNIENGDEKKYPVDEKKYPVDEKKYPVEENRYPVDEKKYPIGRISRKKKKVPSIFD